LSRLSRVAAVAVLSALAALALCSQALADADPASDVLLALDVFYPYSPPVPARLQSLMNGEAAAAHRAHFPVKVAIIAAPTDLGAIPELFDKPRQYAAFLDQEISFGSKVPLLVVMPDGYGTAGVPSAAADAIAALGKPPAGGGSALAQAAIPAVRKLAAAAGHPLGSVSPGPAGGNGGISVAVQVALVAVVCIGLAAGIFVFRRRGDSPEARRR
jgi:hypothetical protein